jgi:hypothetical protein
MREKTGFDGVYFVAVKSVFLGEKRGFDVRVDR